MTKERIGDLIKVAEEIKSGNFSAPLLIAGDDELAKLGQILNEIANLVEVKFKEMRLLSVVTQKINTGIVLDEVLNYTYDNFQDFIPYDRIGFSLIEENGKKVRARWAKTKAQEMILGKGYCAFLENSSLQKIIETGQPRILNDLEAYVQEHPLSESTKKILAEGMHSSLTCPLLVMGKPIGFMFFTSMQKNTYQHLHLDLFLQIAGQFSVIVEKSRIYDEILQKNEELRKLDVAKSNFVSNVSHELRTPLAIIKEGVGQVLEGMHGPINEKQQQFLSMAKRSCDRLLVIVNDLLDMSKLEAKKLRITKEYIDLSRLVSELVLSFETQTAKKGLTLKVLCPPHPLKIEIDSGRITQVFTNFIGNSLKFTAQGSITIELVEQAHHIDCSIIDTGCGISQTDLQKVFQRFEQFGSASGPGAKGTGLGLSICKEIIELHGGNVSVESKLNAGTRVHFSLPKISTKQHFLGILKEIHEKAAHQGLPFAVIALNLNEKDIMGQNKGQEENVLFLNRIEDLLWRLLRQESDRVMRVGTLFYVTVFLDLEEASSVAVRLQKSMEVQLTNDEIFKVPLRLDFKVVSYPYEVATFDELISKIG